VTIVSSPNKALNSTNMISGSANVKKKATGIRQKDSSW
jgi:hypothetical protein